MDFGPDLHGLRGYAEEQIVDRVTKTFVARGLMSQPTVFFITNFIRYKSFGGGGIYNKTYRRIDTKCRSQVPYFGSMKDLHRGEHRIVYRYARYINYLLGKINVPSLIGLASILSPNDVSHIIRLTPHIDSILQVVKTLNRIKFKDPLWITSSNQKELETRRI